MTNEEAIKMFKDIIMVEIKRLPSHYDTEVNDYVYDSISEVDELLQLNKLIRGALEKQIPKKPLHMHKNYYCPICKEDGWMLWDDAIPNDMDKYCGKCGQAIDWEAN